MDRHARRYFAALIVGERVGLDVRQVPFNVPQTVFAPVSGAGDVSRVNMFTRLRR
jgi:hypothetical protein